MKVHCLYDELVNISDLKFHPNNPNQHSQEDIERKAVILAYQGWRYPVNVSKNSGYVVSGEGRARSAKLNGWLQVPVKYQSFENDDQEYSFLVSDNSLSDWSKLDLGMINDKVGDFDPSFEIDLLGIKDFQIDPAEKPKKTIICPHCNQAI